MLDWSILACIAFAILAMFAFAFVVARLLRPAAFEQRKRITLNIDVSCEPPILYDPGFRERQCHLCGALAKAGSTSLICWNCDALLPDAVVDAEDGGPGEAA